MATLRVIVHSHVTWSFGLEPGDLSSGLRSPWAGVAGVQNGFKALLLPVRTLDSEASTPLPSRNGVCFPTPGIRAGPCFVTCHGMWQT